MGNCQPSPMFPNRNKEFQAVVPFPNTSGDSHNSKRRKSSPIKSHRTAPSPGLNESDSTPVDTTELLDVSKTTTKQVEAPSSSSIPSPFTDETVKCNTSIDSAYMQTESQQRRERMADCEFECSKITSYLFVGGYHVATNRDILRQNGITHIINCSAAVVENAFIDDKSLKYISLSMVDGRQDDISWFLCEVIQFIMKARSVGGKILIHCEKGISRSCSFAIAYRMWATGEKWKASFDFVKKGRSICSPNTAFTCNLIELGELLSKDAAATGAGGNLFFRCAYHLPHDPQTAVLKLCRTVESRKVMVPSTSLLDPKGVFIIRTVFSNDESVNRDAEEHRLFLWQGAESTDGTAKRAEALARKMHGVLTTTDKVEWVKQGEETFEFLSYLIEDGPFNSVDNSLFDDFFDYPPSEEQTLISARQMEADHTRNNSKDKDTFGRPMPIRETSIKGFAEFREGPMSRESSIRSNLPLMSRENSLATRGGPGGSLQLDLNGVLGMRGLSSASRDRSEAKIDRIDSYPLSSSGAPSSVDSRRNSDVSAFAYSRIPSIQLPETGTLMDQETPINRRTSPTPSSADAFAGSRRNIPELALSSNNKPASLMQMQRVSEGDLAFSEINSSRMNSSRDTGRDTGRDTARDSGEVRPALPAQIESPVLPMDSTKLNLKRQISDKESINRDYISPDVSTEELPRKKSVSLPPINLPGMLTPQLSLKIPLSALSPESSNNNNTTNSNNTQNSGNSLSPGGIANKLSFPLSVGNKEESMHRQSSAEKLRPGSRELRLFNTNRVAPVPLNESPRPGTSPRGDLPPTGSSRPTSANLNGHSPLTDRRIAGSTASILATLGHGGTTSNNNSTSNLHNGLVTPLKVMERSPSHERNPLDVGLQRGPTPIEDLTTPRIVPRELNPSTPLAINSHHSQSHSSNSPAAALLSPSQIDTNGSSDMRNSSSKASLSMELTKPLLFQAVLQEDHDGSRPGKRTASGAGVARYEWQAMGVYDDDDLDSSSVFLLLCPNRAHYVWLGSSFPTLEAGLTHSESADEEPSQDDVLRWAARVVPGEVKVDGAIGSYLLSNPDVSVEICGDESESFWQDFNDGF